MAVLSDIQTTLALLIVIAALAFEIGARVFALGVIPQNRRPSTGMAWLLLILVDPFIGIVAFLLFGRITVGHKRASKQRLAHDAAVEHLRTIAAPLPPHLPDYVPPVVHLNTRLGSLPVTNGNLMTFIDDYQGSIDAMIEAVDSATSKVHVEFYIVAFDHVTLPLLEALERACARGVRVRLLYDHLATRRVNGYRKLLRWLEASHIESHPMLPLMPFKRRWRRPDLRNHRKLLVIDDRVAFTGSQNLTEPSYNNPKHQRAGRTWVEFMVRIEGPSVTALDAMFSSDWYTETSELLIVEPVVDATTSEAGPGSIEDVTCQVVPSGPGFARENNLRLFTSLIYGATKSLRICSPYFVPDESLLYAVTTAAERGVSVELYVSEESDQFMVGHAQASYYQALLDAGVRIFLYPAPKTLHSKFFTVDDVVAVVGSSNLDMRSFSLNYEVSLVLFDQEATARVEATSELYKQLSHELTAEEWRQRPWIKRYVDNIFRLTAALQ